MRRECKTGFLFFVTAALMLGLVYAAGAAGPSSTLIVEDGIRFDGVGDPHLPEIVELPDGTYRMYYRDHWNQVIKSAVSSDGITWTRESGIRVGAGYGGATTPDVVVLPDGTYRMYWADWENWQHHIASSISTDGLNWTGEAGYRIDVGGPYDSMYALDPNVIKLPDGTYRMYYGGYDGVHYRILSAVSSDGLTWTKESGIRVDYLPDAFIHAMSPEVVEVNGGYAMYFAGYIDGYNGKLYSAVSSDGIAWELEDGVLLSPEGLEGGPYASLHTGSIVKLSSGQYRFYFAGDRWPESERFRILSALVSPAWCANCRENCKK